MFSTLITMLLLAVANHQGQLAGAVTGTDQEFAPATPTIELRKSHQSSPNCKTRTRLGFEALEPRHLLAAVLNPWQLTDIGRVGYASQQMNLDNGTDGLSVDIVTRQSVGVGGSADDFRFLHQQLVGDGEISVRVDGIEGADWFAAAGIAIRDSLAPESQNVSLLNWSAGGTIFTARDEFADSSAPLASNWSTDSKFLKLARAGNTFTGYTSVDGNNWSMLGNPLVVAMNSTVYVGLVASAGLDALQLGTAAFSHIVAPQETDPQPIGSAPTGLVAKYSADWNTWPTGMPQSGTFRFQWNAPVGWTPNGTATNYSGGAINNPSSFRDLHFVTNVDTSYSAFKVESDQTSTDALPANLLQIRGDRLQPGLPAGIDTGAGINGQDRYAIVSYTVPNLDPNIDEGGFFSIEDSFLSKLSGSGDDVEVLVFTSRDPENPAVRNYVRPVTAGTTADRETIAFDGAVGYLAEGETIYIAFGAADSSAGDEALFDFSIWRSEPIDVLHFDETLLGLPSSNSRTASITAPQSGLYSLHNGIAELISSASTAPVELTVRVGDRVVNSQPILLSPGLRRDAPVLDLGYVAKGQSITVTISSIDSAQLNSMEFDFDLAEYAPRAKPLRAEDLSPTLMINVPIPVFSSPGVQNAIQNTANIQAALTQAFNHTEGAINAGKVAHIRLAAGQTYELDKAGLVLNQQNQYLFTLDSFERLIFDGQDATLLIKNAQVGLFDVGSSGSSIQEKLIFQNFTIDHHQDFLPFTQGVIHSIISLDSNSVKVKFDVDLSKYDSPLNARFTPTSNTGYFYELDERGIPTGRMPDGGWSSYVQDTSYSPTSIVHEAGDPANRFTHYVTRSPGISVLINEGPGNGWMVRTRTSTNFRFSSADWVTLENVTSWASPGAFMLYWQTGNLSLLNVKHEIKPGSGRYVSSSADSIHGRSREGLWIENSKFESAGDDLFNAYSQHFAIETQPNSTTLGLGVHNSSNPASPGNFGVRDFLVGEQVALWDPVTGTVVARRYVTGVNTTTQTITIDQPLTGVNLYNPSLAERNMFLINVDSVSNYFVRDSQFLNSFRFGMIIKGNDFYLMGNEYRGNLEAAIQAINEPSWPEAFIAERLHIQGNTFADNARGAMARNRYYLSRDPADIVIGTYYNTTGSTTGNFFVSDRAQHHQIKILDNIFEQWRGMAVSVRNSRDVTISGNTFRGSFDDVTMRTNLDSTTTLPGGSPIPVGPSLNDNDDTTGHYAAIYLYDLEGATVRDNHFEHKDAVFGNNDDEDFDVRWDPISLKHFLLDDVWMD
jgi:hypothetical protein